MIKYITWELSDGSIEYFHIWPFLNQPVQITSIDGLGPVDGILSYTDHAVTNGAKYNRYRIPKRNIVMNVRFRTGSVESDRHISYKLFRPGSTHKMTIVTDSRTVETVVQVEKNTPNIFSNASSAQISLISESSYFRGAGDNDAVIGKLMRGDSGLVFPIEFKEYPNQLIFANSFDNASVITTEYLGDAPTGIHVRISNFPGQYSEIVSMLNRTTEQKMTFRINLGTLAISQIYPNDIFEFSTVPGNRYVRYITNSGIVLNAQSTLDLDSSWIMLEPMAENKIYVVADTEDIQYDFTTMYLGV